MKFGKNFATWLRLIFLIIKALMDWSKSKHPPGDEPGPDIASKVLSDLVNVNEDDSFTKIDSNGNLS